MIRRDCSIRIGRGRMR